MYSCFLFKVCAPDQWKAQGGSPEGTWVRQKRLLLVTVVNLVAMTFSPIDDYNTSRNFENPEFRLTMARFIVAAAWMAALITHAERVDVRDVVAEEGDALRVLVVSQSRGKLGAGGVRRALGAFGARWRDQLETPVDVVVVSSRTLTCIRIRSQRSSPSGRYSEVASEQGCRGLCTGRCIHSPWSRCSPFSPDAPLPLGCRRGTFLTEQHLRVLEPATSRRCHGLQ